VDNRDADKAHLVELFNALDVSPKVLRRDVYGRWILRGRELGCYVSTWDDKSWYIVIASERFTVRQWSAHKRRLSFCELTQEGDVEGCFRLSRLPTQSEAEVIRNIVGLRKRADISPETREAMSIRLSEANKRLEKMV
jgi:hypothetical protein